MIEKVRKCSRAAWCWLMEERLNGHNCHGKGLSSVTVSKLDSGPSRTIGVTHKHSAKDRGVMLNYCPWCGEKIEHWKDEGENNPEGAA